MFWWKSNHYFVNYRASSPKNEISVIIDTPCMTYEQNLYDLVKHQRKYFEKCLFSFVATKTVNGIHNYVVTIT